MVEYVSGHLKIVLEEFEGCLIHLEEEIEKEKEEYLKKQGMYK